MRHIEQCCRLNQHGHVYSLENGEEFVNQSRQQLDDFSLSEYGDVFFAPLKPFVLNKKKFQWYDLEELPELEIDLLIIDGPPGFIQKHSRYPALPLLSKQLAKNCVVFLDDAARDDEQEMVRRWLKTFPEFQADYIDNERGCYILKR